MTDQPLSPAAQSAMVAATNGNFNVVDPVYKQYIAAALPTISQQGHPIMTTRTTVVPAPVDIQTPDSLIQEWLDNWNKGNVSPITLEDLDDITYDLIYRAADHAANLELTKCLFYLRTTGAKQEEDLASALLAYRRPPEEDSQQAELMKEIEDLKEFMMKEIEEQKEFIMTKITKLKNKISQKNNNL